jgi:hypothetical protein
MRGPQLQMKRSKAARHGVECKVVKTVCVHRKRVEDMDFIAQLALSARREACEVGPESRDRTTIRNRRIAYDVHEP